MGGPGSDLTSPAPILLGVTGGVAAYRACELVRLLLKAGHGVQVAVTSEAERFVGPETFSALSRRPVLRDAPALDGAYPHLDASRHRPARVHRAVHREHAREARARPRRQRRHAERAGGAAGR